MEIKYNNDIVVQWLVLLPYSKKVVGSILPWTFLCGGGMFSLCLHRFSPGSLASSQKTCI